MSHMPQSDLFNRFLQLSADELVWEVAPEPHLPLAETDYLVNPRRLRGSDFLMRWAQGRWAEDIVIRTLNRTSEFGAIPYGPSTVAPEDPAELELFFDKMTAIAQEGKRPDVLVFDKPTFVWAERTIQQRLGDISKFAEALSNEFRDVITRATLGLEIENSLWVTEKMPGFGKPFTRYTRGKNKGRLKPAGIVPMIIVKHEDIARLRQWQSAFGVPLYIVHIFYDRGYFVKFDRVLDWLDSGELGMQEQKFTNPDGTASTPKQIVKVPYILCKDFGVVTQQTLVPRTFIDKNGKVMTYATFSGGEIGLAREVLEEWTR